MDKELDYLTDLDWLEEPDFWNSYPLATDYEEPDPDHPYYHAPKDQVKIAPKSD